MNEEWAIIAASWAGFLIFLIVAVVVVVVIVLGAKRLFFICLELAVGLTIIAVVEYSRTE